MDSKQEGATLVDEMTDALQPIEPNTATSAVAVMTSRDSANANRVRLGEKDYYVVTVTGARLFKLGDLAFKAFTTVANSGLIDGSWRQRVQDILGPAPTLPEEATDEEREEARKDRAAAESAKLAQALVSAVGDLWDEAPDVMNKLLCILLNVGMDEMEYVMDNLDAITLFDIIDAFMERNRVEDVLERFFILQEKFATMGAKLQRRGQKNTPPSQPPLSLPEQATEPTPLRP